MAKRQQEKEARRREREAREEAARRAASRKKALQMAAGAGLVILAIAVVGLILVGGGSGSSADASTVAADAQAANCTFRQFPSEGREHVAQKLTAKDYRTNPPTSGHHNPVPAPDGVYAPGNEPSVGNWVHSLEHGRILYQYKPGTPAGDVATLRGLAEQSLNGSPGYHTLVFQNNTNMPSQYAVVAWTRYLTCDQLTPQAQRAMRAFREAFTDQAPERIP